MKTPVGGTHGPEIVPPSPIRGIGRDSDSVITSGTHEHRSVSAGTRTMSVKTIAEAAVEKQRGRERSPHRRDSRDARSASSGGSGQSRTSSALGRRLKTGVRTPPPPPTATLTVAPTGNGSCPTSADHTPVGTSWMNISIPRDLDTSMSTLKGKGSRGVGRRHPPLPPSGI